MAHTFNIISWEVEACLVYIVRLYFNTKLTYQTKRHQHMSFMLLLLLFFNTVFWYPQFFQAGEMTGKIMPTFSTNSKTHFQKNTLAQCSNFLLWQHTEENSLSPYLRQHTAYIFNAEFFIQLEGVLNSPGCVQIHCICCCNSPGPARWFQTQDNLRSFSGPT